MKLQKFIKNKKQKQIFIGAIIGIIVLISGITLYRTFALYKEEKTYNVIKGKVPKFEKCSLAINQEFNFNYSGDEQTFETPCDGNYKLEIWGAEGGKWSSSIQGGYGGYASGEIALSQGKKLYIYVGEKGITTNQGPTSAKNGGYNGGGGIASHNDSGTICAAGGGATHIAFVPGLLEALENQKEQILIVAGGGGGRGQNVGVGNNTMSGSGGGFKGTDSEVFINNWDVVSAYGYGGTQNMGGEFYYSKPALLTDALKKDMKGTFGKGGTRLGSGGGGFYGGGTGGYSGGGGSGYIGNKKLYNKEMYCYNCETNEEIDTKTYTTANVSEEAISEYAKIGNGFARITYLGK